MEAHVREQHVQAGKFWGLEKILGILVQPCAQDGGDGPGDRQVGRESEDKAPSHTDVPGNP